MNAHTLYYNRPPLIDIMMIISLKSANLSSTQNTTGGNDTGPDFGIGAAATVPINWAAVNTINTAGTPGIGGTSCDASNIIISCGPNKAISGS